jgi:GTP-binding protein
MPGTPLFNRIVRAHRAIVDDAPGVTRDRVVARAEHAGRAFLCVDTGGFLADTPRDAATLAARVRAQALAAVAEADCVVCVLDGAAGLAPADRDTIRLLSRAGKPVFFAVNKIDTAGREPNVAEFYAGGTDVSAVSAAYAGMRAPWWRGFPARPRPATSPAEPGWHCWDGRTWASRRC